MQAGGTLSRLKNQFDAYVRKNHEVEVACVQLEQQVKRLKTAALKKGLIKPEEKTE